MASAGVQPLVPRTHLSGSTSSLSGLSLFFHSPISIISADRSHRLGVNVAFAGSRLLLLSGLQYFGEPL